MELQKIIVPVDGSEHAMNAARYSIGLVHKFDCEVLLVHCHKAFPSYLGEPYFQQVVDKTLRQANTLIKPYRELFEKEKINFRDLFFEEPAGKRIPEIAKNEKADLILLGSRGKTDLEGLIIGSVTHQVLHLSPCPVLVVR
jgi:nucleotide-binding universal stress UspA family protein